MVGRNRPLTICWCFDAHREVPRRVDTILVAQGNHTRCGGAFHLFSVAWSACTPFAYSCPHFVFPTTVVRQTSASGASLSLEEVTRGLNHETLNGIVLFPTFQLQNLAVVDTLPRFPYQARVSELELGCYGKNEILRTTHVWRRPHSIVCAGHHRATVCLPTWQNRSCPRHSTLVRILYLNHRSRQPWAPLICRFHFVAN